MGICVSRGSAGETMAVATGKIGEEIATAARKTAGATKF
jgi:hypothetical protein